MFNLNLQIGLFTVLAKLPDGTYTEIKSWLQILATPITLVSLAWYLNNKSGNHPGESEDKKAKIPLKLSFGINPNVGYLNCRKIIIKFIDFQPLERLSSMLVNFGKKIKLEQEQEEILEILEKDTSNPDLENQKQEILNDYLKHIKKLLLEQELATKTHDDPLVQATRDLTSNTMRKLNLGQNQLITHFLSEANLIQGEEPGKENNLPCLLKGANLEGADLTRANLERANLEGANLKDAKLEGVFLRGANLRDANLTDLTHAHLERANLEGANLKGTTLKRTFLQGAILKDANLESARFEFSYLPKTNFKGANLEKAYFGEACVSGSNFEDVNLKGAYFNNSKLNGTSFSKANLESASMSSSDLYRAHFTSANLKNTRFTFSKMYCSFDGAKVEGAYFDRVEDINERTKERLISQGARFYKC